MKLLFITEIAPFPVNGGEKLRTYGLLKLLADLDIDVHVIIGNCEDKDFKKYEIDDLHIHEFNFKPYHKFKRPQKYTRLFEPDEDLVRLINQIMDENSFDIAYVDYLFYGQYIPFFKKRGLPVIYGTHNAQADLIYQRPAASFKNRISLYIDYRINKFHESHYFKNADALIVVSENDAKYHARFMKRKKIHLIPNFLIEDHYQKTKAKKESHIVMTANFQAYQNFAGLEWFVSHVWDEQLAELTELHLVGLGSKEAYNALAKNHPLNNIIAVGEVDDLKPYIAQAKASIVPLLHGSGSRLKCLESMALKTQLISTSKGCEGIVHNNSIKTGDTPEEFKNRIIESIHNSNNTTEAAYEAFLDNYSLAANKRRFQNIINILTENKSKEG